MDRRTYLKSAGAAIGSCVLASTGVAATEYDRTTNIVEAGADPTGSQPIDDVFQEVANDGTLVEFPEGEYLVNQLSLWGLTNFGMRATGDATLVPGDDYHDQTWIGGSDTRDVLIEGFTLDTTEEGVSPTVVISNRDGLVVRDILKKGSQDDGNTAFSFRVVDEDGSGLVENVRAPDGDASGDSVGMYVNTTGTLTVRDCRLEEFGNNGLYASGSEGPVQVEGGFYRNNDVTSIRLGSPGSYVKGADIVVSDPAKDDGNYRAIRVSEGPGPVTIEDVDVRLESGQGTGGIVAASDGGSFDLRDSRIHVNSDYTIVGSDETTGHAVYVDDASGIDDPGERTVRNVSITGDGNRYSAIDLNRGNNTVEATQIQQDGDDRSGVYIAEDASDNTVQDCSIEVTGEQIINDGEVFVQNLTDLAEPKPVSIDPGSGDESETDDGFTPLSTDTETEQLESQSADTERQGGDRTLTVAGGGESTEVEYEFEVSGSVRGAGESTESADSVDDDSVSGTLWGVEDTYRFSGQLTSITTDGAVDVSLDGGSASDDDRTFTIGGGTDPESVNYEFEVSGSVHGVEETTEGVDSVDGNSASGALWGVDDTYQYSGRLTDVSTDGAVDISLDDG